MNVSDFFIIIFIRSSSTLAQNKSSSLPDQILSVTNWNSKILFELLILYIPLFCLLQIAV